MLHWEEILFDNTSWEAQSCVNNCKWRLTQILYKNRIMISAGSSRDYLANNQVRLFDTFEDAKEWCQRLEDAYEVSQREGIEYNDY